MTENQKYGQLADIEFCIRRYYQENMAPILKTESERLRANQEKEVRDHKDEWIVYNDTMNPFNGTTRSSAVWSKRNADYLVSEVNGKFFSDSSSSHDMTALVVAWKSAYIKVYGADKYNELSSKTEQGDLAAEYVFGRMKALMIEDLAKRQVPRSSLEYMLRAGLGGSVAGIGSMFEGVLSGRTGAADLDVADLAMKIYNPSAGEKVGREVISVLCDGSFGGSTAVRAAGSAMTDVAIRFGISALHKGKGTDAEQLSELVFGDKDAMQHVSDESRKLNVSDSKAILDLNASMKKKIHLPVDNQAISRNTAIFVNVADKSGTATLDAVRETLRDRGLAYLPQKKVPDWMKNKMDEERCIRNAGYFLALASEMQSKGRDKIRLGKSEVTLKEATQKAYDYARAADWFHQRNGLTEKEKIEYSLDRNESEIRAMGLLSDNISRVHDVNDSPILQNIRASLHKNGLSYVPEHAYPKWMDAMSRSELEQNAKSWRNLAVRMQSEKKADQVVKGIGRMTLQEVTQRAYDYATAADRIFKEGREERAAKVGASEQLHNDLDQWDKDMAALNAQINATGVHSQQQDPNIHQAAMVQQGGGMSYQTTQAVGHAVPQDQPVQGRQPSQNLQGWDNLMEQSGFGNLTHFGKGFGETMTIMPELLAGMFTGKIKNFRLEDNMLPLGLLMAGLFVNKKAHPILKLLLLAFGCMMLLNNANNAVHGVERSQSQAKPTYRRYEEEELSPRIKNPVVKGNTLIADIDGNHMVLTINEDQVLDAYGKGVIPLNNLCNAALRSYDEQGGWSGHYERELAREQQEQEERVRGLR